MRHLVGSLLSGLAAGLLLGCSLSTVGAMDPVEGGKCDTPMQTQKGADGCSECTCNGKTWDCQSDACTASCQAGDKKLADDGCNQCSCGTDGKWSCTTDQKCSMPSCTPGDTKLRDDGCATCKCDATGNWDCPDTACAKCTPGEKLVNGCQTCVCNDTGTDYSCTGPTDGNCGSPQACTPGDKTTESCKTCICNATGSAWDCMASMDPGCGTPQCTPGQGYPAADGCNTCTCLDDGTLACTMKVCDVACPPPNMSNGTCPPEMVYAQNPMTKDCCAYNSKCEAPTGWNYYTRPDCSTATPTTCSDTMADCNAESADGCETDLTSSPLNCGACGNVCMAPPNEVGVCVQGKCVIPNGPTCLYGGVTYAPGEMFEGRDGCTSCSCSLGGDSQASVLCTMSTCNCNSEKEPYRQYVTTAPTECQIIDFMCPENTTTFSDSCGCGCEQSTDCPNEFDCTPDPMTMQTNCDPGLMARCPYSSVTN
jgi:hypothetical protein